MSRVHADQKFMNTSKYDQSVTGPSKMTRIHSENEDYHKASTLSAWLFMKYDKSYKWFRNKSSNRREELRAEYDKDTYEYRFDNYLRKFDKTRKDFEGMSDVIKVAWRDEFEQYEASEREKQMERSASQHGYRVSGKDNLLSGGTYTPNPEEEDAYALLVDIGVPFGSDGEPLGIGWDD